MASADCKSILFFILLEERQHFPWRWLVEDAAMRGFLFFVAGLEHSVVDGTIDFFVFIDSTEFLILFFCWDF